MGIYSTAAANLLKENEVEYNPNAASLLEFAVNSQRADQAMFESMLEMDMSEYFIESGVLVVTENDKLEGAGNALKAIGKKIVDLVEKAIQTLEAAWNKFQNFVLEKSKADKLLLKKFGKDFDMNKVKANAGEKTVTVLQPVATIYVGKFVNEKSAEAKAACGELTGTKETFDQKKEAVKKDFANQVNGEVFDKAFASKKVSELTKKEIDDVVAAFEGGYKGLVDTFVKDADVKNTLKELKEARKSALKAALPKKGQSEEDRAVASSKFAYIAELCSDITKAFNFATRAAAKAMVSARKAYIAFGVANAKKEKAAEEVKEAVEFDYDDILEYALENATDNIFEEASF